MSPKLTIQTVSLLCLILNKGKSELNRYLSLNIENINFITHIGKAINVRALKTVKLAIA